MRARSSSRARSARLCARRCILMRAGCWPPPCMAPKEASGWKRYRGRRPRSTRRQPAVLSHPAALSRKRAASSSCRPMCRSGRTGSQGASWRNAPGSLPRRKYRAAGWSGGCFERGGGTVQPAISLRKFGLKRSGAISADGPHFARSTLQTLIDDLDNPVGTRIHQNRPVVHDRVAIIPGAIFPRHLVIGDALLRQFGADPDILAILIGRTTLPAHILANAWTLTDHN